MHSLYARKNSMHCPSADTKLCPPDGPQLPQAHLIPVIVRPLETVQGGLACSLTWVCVLLFQYTPSSPNAATPSSEVTTHLAGSTSGLMISISVKTGAELAGATIMVSDSLERYSCSPRASRDHGSEVQAGLQRRLAAWRVEPERPWSLSARTAYVSVR